MRSIARRNDAAARSRRYASGKSILCVFLSAMATLPCSLVTSCDGSLLPDPDASDRIFDHLRADVDGVVASEISDAKEKLMVAYWHTSHGSQLITGVAGMDAFFGGEGWYTLGGDGGLAVDEQGSDLGNPGLAEFDASVREYLAVRPETNVVMASWCGQLSDADEAYVDTYLGLMTALEDDYPGVTFVFMTGHADGTGLEGNLHARNLQIRDFCEASGKWLFDFYDIECYDPDDEYFGDKRVDDACGYDGGNWALEWQAAHPDGYWDCESAHSEPVNANRKAMAAWRLWIALAAEISALSP